MGISTAISILSLVSKPCASTVATAFNISVSQP